MKTAEAWKRWRQEQEGATEEIFSHRLQAGNLLSQEGGERERRRGKNRRYFHGECSGGRNFFFFFCPVRERGEGEREFYGGQ